MYYNTYTMFTLRGENTIVNATEVQRDFSRVMAQVGKQTIIIIRNNEPIAAIVSLDKLKKIQCEEEGKKMGGPSFRNK